MPDPPLTSRRCSSDPVYLSSHFTRDPHPHSGQRRPAAFHKTSLQARNYLDPPSASPSSSSTDSAPENTSLSSEVLGGHAPASSIIPPQVCTRIESWHRRRSSFEPLWEASGTFGEEDVKKFRNMGARVNKLAQKARSQCSAVTADVDSSIDRHQIKDRASDGGPTARTANGKGSGCFRVSLNPISRLSQPLLLSHRGMDEVVSK